MSKDELLGKAEKAVQYAVRHGAEQAEAFIEDSRGGSVRIEKNHISGIEADTTFGIGLRVVKAQRIGFSHLTNLDDLGRAVEDALSNAKLAKKNPNFVFASKKKFPTVRKIFDPKIAALTGPDVVAMAVDLVAGAHDVRASLNVTEAGVSFGQLRSAIANSEGLSCSNTESSIAASCYVVQSETGVSTGFATQEATLMRLDPTGLGKEAATLALDARSPKKLDKAGTPTLLLRPDPAADLIGTLTVPSLYGKSAMRGESIYSNKVGKKVAHSKFSLVDDPTVDGGLGSSPFDDEGEPSRAFRPIKNGVLSGYLFDRGGAAEFRKKETASALRVHPFDGRSYKSPPGISARNVRVESPSKPTPKLLAGVDDGLWVHDMMGVHTANTVSGDFSVTSTVLFRIRKGAIEGPVAPVSIAGNLHSVLKQGLLLGDDVKQTSGEAAISMPTVRFDGFSVTP